MSTNTTSSNTPIKKSGPLRKRIEYLHRMSGFDKNFGTAIQQHLEMLRDYGVNGTKEIKTREEMCDFLMSKFFFDKLDYFASKKYRCNVDENSDWPVPVLPSEVFSDPKPSDEYRRKFFLSCLNVGDVLDCRVSSVQPTEYQLRVIHKYGTARILDDLNLTVTMGRTKKELTILEKDLIACELIRVAVTRIEKLTESILVTVDGNSLETLKKLPELGRISEKELPAYVLDPPDPEKYPSYADYLDSMPEFNNPTLLNDIIEGFGLKPTNVYTYYPRFDELSCSEELSAQFLLWHSKKNESKSYADAAVKEQRKNNHEEALALTGKAIQAYPDNDQNLAMLYDFKAACYLRKGSEGKLMHALCENIAYEFLPDNKQVKKNLSKHLFKAANGCYKQKNYKKSAFLAEKALEVCDNELAKSLLHVLKTKHADQFMNLEKESIYQLQVKKKQLVTELKQMDIN